MKNLDCESVLEQLSEYVDAETRAELREAIQDHLARCQDCQIKVDTVKRTILLYQSGSTVELPIGVHTGLSAVLAREYSSR